jgi:cell division protein FtsI/penicillin-binding protein 2
MFIISERPAHSELDIDIAGKTGTAENFAKIGGKKFLKDHSIFVA